jgi:hypothetical protein
MTITELFLLVFVSKEALNGGQRVLIVSKHAKSGFFDSRIPPILSLVVLLVFGQHRLVNDGLVCQKSGFSPTLGLGFPPKFEF